MLGLAHGPARPATRKREKEILQPLAAAI